MLQVHHLHKSYGAATILADLTFLINDREHVGLVSPNGVGKTTLLRCLVGQETPDSGTISFTPPDLRIGYLPQSFEHAADLTIHQVIAAAQAEWRDAGVALQQAADALASTANLEAAMTAYDVALARFEALGGYAREQQAAAILQGLGLGDVAQETGVHTLSGGQKTRLGLATLLLSQPDLLLLDEPTNHLDVEALEWLEQFVRTYPRAVLIVSHDREFLDQTAERILFLDPLSRAMRSYPGNYSAFAAAREREHEQHVEMWQDQQDYIQQVEDDITRIRGRAQSIQNGPKRHRDHYGRVSVKVARLARARERKLERYRESDERVDKPRQNWGLKLDFGEPPPSGRAVLRIEELGFAYPQPTTDDSPQHAARLLAGVSFEVQYGERVALVGPNGAGKTTLLRLIAGQLQPLEGSVRLGSNVRLGVMSQEQETLDLERTVLETARRARSMSETEARNFLHFFLFGGDSVFRKVGECSLGQRTRLQLALLVLQGCNLLLLDEPLNHLDIESREHFEAALEAFEGTIIAVAHDRAFLRTFAERVIDVRNGQARMIEGDRV